MSPVMTKVSPACSSYSTVVSMVLGKQLENIQASLGLASLELSSAMVRSTASELKQRFSGAGRLDLYSWAWLPWQISRQAAIARMDFILVF